MPESYSATLVWLDGDPDSFITVSWQSSQQSCRVLRDYQQCQGSRVGDAAHVKDQGFGEVRKAAVDDEEQKLHQKLVV